MSDLVHKGHRQRMRRKFSDNGPRVFDTYELLEMLLYRTVTAKDTNPHAKLLLAEFGSLEGVMSANADKLIGVKGIGEKSAALIEEISRALEISYHDSPSHSDCCDNYDELGQRLLEYFEDKKQPGVIMLSLDNAMRLISLDEIYDIDYDSGAVRPAAFIDKAVSRSASVVIIAHNHPFGPICPTEGDRATNALICSALGNIGITLVEHYVVSGSMYFGFMNTKLDGVFRQKPALEKFVMSKRSATDGI